MGTSSFNGLIGISLALFIDDLKMVRGGLARNHTCANTHLNGMKTKTISLGKGNRVEKEVGLRLSDDDNYV